MKYQFFFSFLIYVVFAIQGGLISSKVSAADFSMAELEEEDGQKLFEYYLKLDESKRKKLFPLIKESNLGEELLLQSFKACILDLLLSKEERGKTSRLIGNFNFENYFTNLEETLGFSHPDDFASFISKQGIIFNDEERKKLWELEERLPSSFYYCISCKERELFKAAFTAASIKKVPEKPVLILDLDNTLAQNILAQNTKNSNHYLFMGYLREFLNYVNEDFEVHFFSAGIKERNEYLVPKIWKYAFNKKFPDDKVKIMSSGDLSSASKYKKTLLPKNDGIRWNNSKLFMNRKDLSIFGYDLNHVILVDDNPMAGAIGQKKNILIPLRHKITYYFENMEKAKKNKVFYDQLIFDIKEELMKKEEDRRALTSNSDEQEKILVSQSNFYNALAFYKLVYVAGVLEEVKELSKEKKIPIAEALYQIQYSPDGIPQHYDRMLTFRFYQRGFKILKEIGEKKGVPFQSFHPKIEKLFELPHREKNEEGGDKID